MMARMRERFREILAGDRNPGWFLTAKRAAIGLCVLVICAQFIRLTVHLKGDFDVHWESGRRLAEGEPLYAWQGGQDERGHNYPYPPFWALVHAPLTWLPMPLAQLLTYPLLVLAGFLLIKTLNRLTQPHESLNDNQSFLVAAGAVFFTSRFLVRDMPECGVNLALVALSWLAVEFWVHRRDWAGGWCLGLAISLKCTPALFWAWFLWKRQWKIAGTTLAAAAVFTLSPVLLMGMGTFQHTMLTWTGNAWRGVGETHPAYGVLGDEPLQNISLRPALARYLTVLPEGHRSRIDHPLFVEGLDLAPLAAGWLIKFLLAGLVFFTAYQFRHPVRDRADPTWLWEAAAVSVLILLLSPITWGQHCVGVLPAFYLLTRRRIAGKDLPGWTKAVIWVYVVGILFLNRELLGQELTYLLDSYRFPTIVLLGFFAVVIRVRSLVREESPEAAAEPIPESHPPSQAYAQGEFAA
jgi:alpha-1,2-mannosyltransferase